VASRNTNTTTSRRAKPAPRKAAGKKPRTATAESPESAFAEALSADFVRHGASAITRLREDDPIAYMKLCASVLPKALIDSVDPLEPLTDEELRQRAHYLAEKAGLGAHPDPDGAGAPDKPK
jgi:hypothetical protein